MEPLQPTPPPASPSPNPYEFITNPSPKSKRPSLIQPGTMRARILLVVGIGVFLMVGVIVASSLLNGKGEKNVTALHSLLAEQEEIMRIAIYGTTESKDSETLNLATTTLESVASDQLKLQGYLKSRKVKTPKGTIESKKDSSTDDKLSEAQQSNNFEPVFKTTLVTMLNKYLKSTQAAYDATSNETSKTILADSYNSVEIIAKHYGEQAAN